ncbi:MAG: hypothetical protein ACOYMB_01840 [Patescibacteria group bacterium]
MKFEVKQKYLSLRPDQFVQRHCGYARIVDHETNQESFANRLTRDFYPRFHLYLDSRVDDGDEIIIFSLHLDQKKSGQSETRHSAEYDGELVEGEVARLKSLVIDNYRNG